MNNFKYHALNGKKKKKKHGCFVFHRSPEGRSSVSNSTPGLYFGRWSKPCLQTVVIKLCTLQPTFDKVFNSSRGNNNVKTE